MSVGFFHFGVSDHYGVENIRRFAEFLLCFGKNRSECGCVFVFHFVCCQGLISSGGWNQITCNACRLVGAITRTHFEM